MNFTFLTLILTFILLFHGSTAEPAEDTFSAPHGGVLTTLKAGKHIVEMVFTPKVLKFYVYDKKSLKPASMLEPWKVRIQISYAGRTDKPDISISEDGFEVIAKVKRELKTKFLCLFDIAKTEGGDFIHYMYWFRVSHGYVANTHSSSTPEVGSKDGFKLHEKLPFTEGDKPLNLDLYLPENISKPVPCIMVIQGGGFKPQTGNRFRSFAEKFARAGFAAALISYRGQPKNNYIDTMADVKASVRFVRSVAPKYKIDPDKIGSMGRSAGGTISVLLGVTGDVKELEGKRGHAKYSSRIQAAVGLAGVYDFPARFTDKEQTAQVSNQAKKKASNGAWIQAPFSEKNEHWIRASAINHLDKKDPPVILFHCKNDGTVPWQQSRDMFEKLKPLKNGSELKLFDEGGHGVGVKNLDKMMVDFFRKSLQGKPAAKRKG